MEAGHISGLNGLVLGLAKERNINAFCLLATMPQYAISLPNPKASGAIIEALEKILNFVVSLEEMDEYIKVKFDNNVTEKRTIKNIKRRRA